MLHFTDFLKAGILQFSWVGMVVATLILTHITIAAVTIFLHRCQTHRALDLHAIPSHFFRVWLWMTTGMRTKAWVAIHRKHHAFCETENDPHSPQIFGIKRVLFEGAELYKLGAKDKALVERYGKGTPDDWMERNVYTPMTAKGIYIMMAIDILMFGLPGIIIWAVQMMWIPFFAAGVINGVGHYWGYRNFECADAARNILPLGILIGGEEFHNNHHTYGSSAKLSVKWWEFDIGWFYIRCLSALGLAKVRKTIPETALQAGKTTVDEETLKAILGNRFLVLEKYSKEVITPVFDAEREKAVGSSITRRIKSLLIREKTLVSDVDEATLQKAIKTHHSLKTVYDFRMTLQGLWVRSTASQAELIESIAAWCVEAEKSGVDALYMFAQKLKTFVPAP